MQNDEMDESVKQKMAVEIPKDLITQLQIALRKQANVPSYDPNDSSLPNLPSLPHLISDSPHFRCLHCKAHLLRGPDSLFCIFCGKCQSNSETPPQPIKFKSTSGYRWFLRSLNLDGSETVGESLEGNEWNRGPRQEFRLSDLLDLEIRWNDAEPESFESSLGKNNHLNLAGLDLDDDFLAERKGDSVSIPTQGTLPLKEEIDSTGSEFQSRQNLSLFENQVSKSSGSVSGWQADFQSADSRTDHNAISSQSSDPFVGSSKDLSAHVDMVSGQVNNLFDGKEDDNQSSSKSQTNNSFRDDMQSNSTSGVRIDQANISSSANVDWVQGDQGQIIGNNTPNKRTPDDDDDSFDAWNDFKGSASAPDAAKTYWDQTTDGMKSMNEKVHDSFSGWGPGSESTAFETQHEVSKSFDNFAGSSADLSTHTDSVFGTGKDSFHGKAVDNRTSSHTNWFQDDLWSNSTSGTVHHAEQSDLNVGNKDDGMLGNTKSPVSVNGIEDDQWPTSSNKAVDDGTNDEDDDSFGAWNDFKGSSAWGSSISSWKEPANCSSSTEEKSSDPFSGWDTDFQSASSTNHNDSSKSFDPLVGSSIVLSDHMDTVFASGKDFVDGKAKDGSNVSSTNNWFQDDLWSNSTSKVTCQAENFDATIDVMDSGAAQSMHNSPSMNVDWFPDDQWLTGNNKAPDRKNVDKSDNSFREWNDFKSSITMQDAFSDPSKQAARPDKITIDDNDDLSAAWNDFTSSISVNDPSSISFKHTVNHEKPSIGTSEIHFFSMDSNSHDNNSGNLSQPDLFPRSFSNQNGSTEAPVSNRMADASVRGGSNAEVAKNGGFSSATTGSKTDDIEILMSQMHDLSFMLERNLSIPPKVDEYN
ncbi:hypothetical protein QUC31_004049 [Theobroma cacao]